MSRDPRDRLSPSLFAAYHKKSLALDFLRQEIRLDVPFDVFSTFDVDTGTRRLLRQIAKAAPRWGSALDLGCGYGPLALAVAKAQVAGRVDGIDRDALAVAFARHNARKNRLPDLDLRGALAYEDVGARYDAVLCNLPAKAGAGVHRLMMLGAFDHLTPGGEVWLVVVRVLEPAVDEILSADGIELRRKVRAGEHTVYHYGFSGAPPAAPRSPYLREVRRFDWRGHRYTLEALHGLAEYDSRSRATDAVLDLLRHHAKAAGVKAAMVCEPGQGHVPVLLPILWPGLERISIAARNLLALRATEANLRKNSYEGDLRCVHTAEPAAACQPPHPDLIVAMLREKEGIDANVEKVRQLLAASPGRPLIAGCKSAFASRLERQLHRCGVRSRRKKKLRGFCAVCFTQGGPAAKAD